MSSEPTRVALRPTRSPKCPNNTEPIGRATNARPNVANDESSAAVSLPFGKNSVGNTRTAAVA
ncbi:Uncharacterised protein [Mycobacteroides abscessus subsp. abscessus]|nr:Uncharacterised protein [Mycobacteroides abscessus subsp. abscessus]